MVAALSGKVVAVVGATGGIGRAFAERAVAEGARVILAGRRPDALGQIQRALAGAGAAVKTQAVDVTDPASVEAFADAALGSGSSLFGTLDVVVVATGQSVRKPVHAHTDAEVQSTLALNLTGTIWLVRALLKPERRFDGQIVLLGGFSDGRLAFPYYSVDVATRAAVFSFAEAVNRELALDDRKALLSYFCPAPADTEAERPYHAVWQEMGVAVVPVAAVCDELVRCIRRRERVHIMGGAANSVFTALNSVWPSAADAVAMRGFGRILQRYFGRPPPPPPSSAS